jgi:hypothetical protein
MTERELLAAERVEYRRLTALPVTVRDCDGCGGLSDHVYDLENDETVCLACRLSRIVGMADAIRDVAGRAQWEAEQRIAGKRFSDA